jgi:hypothetical protein
LGRISAHDSAINPARDSPMSDDEKAAERRRKAAEQNPGCKVVTPAAKTAGQS